MTENPSTEHRGSESISPVKIQIRSHVIAHQMEKFQVLLDLDGIDAHQINISLAADKNRNNIF